MLVMQDCEWHSVKYISDTASLKVYEIRDIIAFIRSGGMRNHYRIEKQQRDGMNYYRVVPQY